MNTRLVKLVESSLLHENDAQDIYRIFEVLSDSRKIEILDNWQSYARKIILHREKIEQEKYLLLSKTLDTIETDVRDLEKTLRRTVVLGE